MAKRKAARPTRPVSAKRPPSDITPTSTPRKRPSGSLVQRPSTTPSSKNQITPPAIPTPASTILPQQMPAPQQESNRTGARVTAPKLPQPTPTSTPFLANRLASMNCDLMMKARTMQMGTYRANGIRPGPLPRNRERGRPGMPVNSGGSADLPSSILAQSRPLPYTTQNGQKIPSRSVPKLTTGTYSPRHGNAILVTSRSELPTQGRPYTPRSSAGAQLPYSHRLSAGGPPPSTQNAGDAATADVLQASNGGTPSSNAVRTSRPVNEGDMRPKAIATKFPRNRRRPVVVDAEEEESDEEILIHSPTISRQPMRKRHISPISSPSPQPFAEQAPEYIVPPELEGVRSAIGNHDWRTYVGFMERLINGEITEQEFEIMAGGIFQMTDKKLEKKVHKMTHRMIKEIDS
jgi:hypothetical protein